ncbi:hypothetical protein DH2020_025286 [Rehmannia glutinosa]|uniref:Uncharacterized protein n=1 Tax=Rehmannia glutinosa TaxID=99300 RepID=A0ABR0W055_REHGL
METEVEAPDLVCELDSVQGIVDALTSVRWKRHQAHGRPRFGASLGLFVDCLNTFSVPGRSNILELRYPGPDMQLLLRSVDSPDACIYAEIRTRIPETISWDYNFEPAGSTPLSFTVKSAALKEAIDDLEWPGSSIHIKLQPTPPSVIFKGEGHGDLQIDFNYYANTDLLIAFSCDRQISHRFINFHLACHATTTLPSASTGFANHRYKYKFLRATTSNIPSSVIRDNRGSKLTIGRGGMLKVQHLVSVAKPSIPHPHVDLAGYQQPSRIAYIEFFVKPEVEDDSVNDS